MRIENIIKNLTKQGMEVVRAEFDHQEVNFCNGTALVDLDNGKVVETSATFKDVINQIENNKSHIYTINDKKKTLNENNKLGY